MRGSKFSEDIDCFSCSLFADQIVRAPFLASRVPDMSASSSQTAPVAPPARALGAMTVAELQALVLQRENALKEAKAQLSLTKKNTDILINLTQPSGNVIPLMVKPKNTIKQVKIKFINETGFAGDYDDVDLLFGITGRLNNNRIVSGCGITEGATVTLVLRNYGVPINDNGVRVPDDATLVQIEEGIDREVDAVIDRAERARDNEAETSDNEASDNEDAFTYDISHYLHLDGAYETVSLPRFYIVDDSDFNPFFVASVREFRGKELMRFRASQGATTMDIKSKFVEHVRYYNKDDPSANIPDVGDFRLMHGGLMLDDDTIVGTAMGSSSGAVMDFIIVLRVRGGGKRARVANTEPLVIKDDDEAIIKSILATFSKPWSMDDWEQMAMDNSITPDILREMAKSVDGGTNYIKAMRVLESIPAVKQVKARGCLHCFAGCL